MFVISLKYCEEGWCLCYFRKGYVTFVVTCTQATEIQDGGKILICRIENDDDGLSALTLSTKAGFNNGRVKDIH